MSAPAVLSGATAVLKINGTDVKTYGMLIESISDGMPEVRSAEEVIPRRHGSIDITNTYGGKNLNISGSIIADTHADLLTYLDALKSLVRLRFDGEGVPVELQDRTGYEYSARLVSFTINKRSLWYNTREATFNMMLRTSQPWAEKATSTTATNEVQCGKMISIVNAGNAPTPLSLEVRPKPSLNLFSGQCDAHGGWSNSNGTLSTYAGAAVVPCIYGTNSIRVQRTAGGSDFSAYQDVVATIQTDEYYVLSAYIRPIGSPANTQFKVQLRSDVQTDAGSNLGSNACIGRSFVKINGADHIGFTYAYLEIIAEQNNNDFYFDGVMLEQITAAEYADDDFLPGPYTDDGDSGTTYGCGGLEAAVTGKNLCPAGAKDLDIDNWDSGSSESKIIYDEEVGRPVLFNNGEGSNYWLSTKHFRLDPGEYTLSFKHRYLTTGAIYAKIVCIGENTAAKIDAGTWDTTYFDGQLVSTALTGDEAWTTFEETFTVPYGVTYVALRFYDNAGATWDTLMLTEIQIELADAATAYEPYRKKSFALYPTFNTLAEDKILIDARHKQAVYSYDTTHIVRNTMGQFTGSFLELLPGANTLIVNTARVSDSTPEERGSAFTLITKYRERKI